MIVLSIRHQISTENRSSVPVAIQVSRRNHRQPDRARNVGLLTHVHSGYWTRSSKRFGVTTTPVSSRHSRAAQDSGDSPTSHLPPGNSASPDRSCPACLVPTRYRLANSTMAMPIFLTVRSVIAADSSVIAYKGRVFTKACRICDKYAGAINLHYFVCQAKTIQCRTPICRMTVHGLQSSAIHIQVVCNLYFEI